MAQRPRLSERTFHPDPIEQFRRWFRAVKRAGLPEPNAMTLATADPAGHLSARMVLLKGVTDRGFLFFTNYESRKGRELKANPHAALVFYWCQVNRQVRVTGRVSKLPAAESDVYFSTRPHGSRLAALASQQSVVIPSRAALESHYAELATRYPNDGPPRPINWGGYCVHPDEIEFWQQGPNRLHDRLRYRKSRGAWVLERLSP
ncbi:MAG: pyridoxamine 5'-phosphate oxidase [Acidobacteriota bacterium]